MRNRTARQRPGSIWQNGCKPEDDIIRLLAILDKRVGKRTLQKIKEAEEYKRYPEWVRQFYELRLKETE